MIACNIIGLESLHLKGYLHKDVKPENMIFNEKCYLHLTDYGISKEFKMNNRKETSGTLAY
jgi:serine/threonine protein kinase